MNIEKRGKRVSWCTRPLQEKENLGSILDSGQGRVCEKKKKKEKEKRKRKKESQSLVQGVNKR